MGGCLVIQIRQNGYHGWFIVDDASFPGTGYLHPDGQWRRDMMMPGPGRRMGYFSSEAAAEDLVERYKVGDVEIEESIWEGIE